MIHLGDITNISGYTAPIVDCIIGGSPCQDLSIAGKRAGLDGERSGLFMEQIRIIKEMRKRNDGTTDIRPRYMVWENVPGAFSSNKGEDFRIVLEETAKVADENAVIPEPPKGKWTTSGCIVGDGWSIAWRVLDAQFWGVPQRRRRIALVADFGGHSASEILFVRQSMSRHTEPGKQKRENSTEDASGCIGTTDCIGVNGELTPITFEPGITSREGGHIYEGVSGTLRANAGDNQMATAYGISSYNSNAMKSNNPHSGIYEADTSRTLDLNGGNPSCNQGGVCIVEPVPYTLKIRSGCEGGGKGALVQTDKSATLSTLQDQTLFQPVICLQGNGIGRADTAGCNGKGWREDVSYTLNTLDRPAVVYSVENHPNDSRVKIDERGKVQTLSGRMGTGGGNVPMVLSLDRASFNQGKNAQFDFEVSDKGINSPLVAKGPSAVCYERPKFRYTVRRLTPLECERLQGYPDGWTDIGDWTDSNGKVRKTSDAARYKALGNSIAIPPWKWVIKRLCACYERDATMASLFDGIGGFPYIWEQINGKGSCLWASEIEEFPIAVTKERIK